MRDNLFRRRHWYGGPKPHMKREVDTSRQPTNFSDMDDGYMTFVLRAQKCREKAEDAKNSIEKETWLAIAEEYLYLAQAMGPRPTA